MAFASQATYQCNGTQLRRCLGDQTWEEVARCASPVLCVTSFEGERATSGRVLAARVPDGRRVHVRRRGALRVQAGSLDLGHGRHLPLRRALQRSSTSAASSPTCEANELRCFGNELRRCNAGLDGWDVELTCALGEFLLERSRRSRLQARVSEPDPLQRRRARALHAERLGASGELRDERPLLVHPRTTRAPSGSLRTAVERPSAAGRKPVISARVPHCRNAR